MSSKKSVGITLIKRLKEKYNENIDSKYDAMTKIPSKELRDYIRAIAKNISDGISIHAKNNYPEVVYVDNVSYNNKWTEEGYKDQIVLTITIDPEYHNHVLSTRRNIDKINESKMKAKENLEQWELECLEIILNGEGITIPVFEV